MDFPLLFSPWGPISLPCFPLKFKGLKNCWSVLSTRRFSEACLLLCFFSQRPDKTGFGESMRAGENGKTNESASFGSRLRTHPLEPASWCRVLDSAKHLLLTLLGSASRGRKGSLQGRRGLLLGGACGLLVCLRFLWASLRNTPSWHGSWIWFAASYTYQSSFTVWPLPAMYTPPPLTSPLFPLQRSNSLPAHGGLSPKLLSLKIPECFFCFSICREGSCFLQLLLLCCLPVIFFLYLTNLNLVNNYLCHFSLFRSLLPSWILMGRERKSWLDLCCPTCWH